MRRIGHILKKEFRQIFRHKTMLPILFVMPFVQLLVLPFAADYEIKEIKLLILDMDQSPFSRLLKQKIMASEYFQAFEIQGGSREAFQLIDAREADLFMHIPPHFERQLMKEGESSLQITIDAINGSKALVAQGYLQNIIVDYRKEIVSRWLPVTHMLPARQPIEIRHRHWYNPDLDYDTLMVPGILVMLITMIGGFLSGMNIVKEKEIGTIEQINVTPVRKYQFIIGKLLPFWIIAMIDLAIGLVIARWVFSIPMVGSLGLIFLFAAMYLLVVLGLGLLISTITRTQQQSMFITWFLMVIFILMSGLFTPIESMPSWAQDLTRGNPIAYFVEVMRMVLLKGSDWLDIQNHFAITSSMAAGLIILAILNYRKVTA